MAGRKNLLKNNSAQGGLDHWEVLENGGDGFAVEHPPAGCKSLEECCKNKGRKCCWATSHNPCEKSQLIDLMGAGLSDHKLDKKKPPIRVRDWYSARGDCGCNYRICVRLLGSDKEELDKWDFQDTKEEGATWTKVRHVFKDYPEGVRFVEFRHGGEDTKNWAGHFGVKLARSGVHVGQKRSRRARRILKGQNLIKNPCAKDEFEGWEVLSSGGDGMICEAAPGGCKPPAECGADLGDGVGCWATSNGLGQKRQVVDLAAAGLDGGFMDERRPDIKISDWYGVRTDAGCKYSLQVRLLNADQGEVDKFEFQEEKDASGDWFQASHSFQGYCEGVRFVEFTHGGSDTCFWAGHYGVRLTGSSVIVSSATADKPSNSSSSSSSSSSSDDE